MAINNLLSERYRFREGYIPVKLTEPQKAARKLYLDQIHQKSRYISIKKCPYCGSDNFTKISEIDCKGLPSDIVICDSCGGCFKSEVLDREANQYLYGNISYLLRGKDLSNEAMEKLFLKRIKLFAYPRHYFIQHFIGLKPTQGFVAEFGCNDGANLFPWHEKGFSALGIELDLKMIEFGQRKGLQLIEGDILSHDFAYKKPKLIILSHLLEHVTDVNAVLKRLSQDLQPDGFLFIEVPGIRAQGPEGPLECFDTEHNYYFDSSSLARLLEKHSFRILYIDEYARVLCTPEKNRFVQTDKSMRLSLDALRAGLAKAALDMLGLRNKSPIDLLRRCESADFRVKIFNKLQDLYFCYYYRSIIRSEVENEKKLYGKA